MPYKLNHTTGKFEKVKGSGTSSKKNAGKSTNSTKKSNGSSGSSNSNNSSESHLKSNNTSRKSTKGKLEKKTNQKTIRTLESDVKVLPTENTIKIKAGSTIKMYNLGNKLTGRYYVKSVTRTIDSSGYSQSLSVIKTNFGKSLKTIAKKPQLSGDEKIKKESSENIVEKKKNEGKNLIVHTVKKGETLYSISKKYYKTTKKANKIASANFMAKTTKKWKHPPVGMKLIIP